MADTHRDKDILLLICYNLPQRYEPLKIDDVVINNNSASFGIRIKR